MKAIRDIFVKNEIAKMIRHSKNQFILLCLVFALSIIALNQSILVCKRSIKNILTLLLTISKSPRPKMHQDRVAMVKSIVQKIFFRTVEKQAENRKVNELHYEFIAFSNPKTGNG